MHHTGTKEQHKQHRRLHLEVTNFVTAASQQRHKDGNLGTEVEQNSVHNRTVRDRFNLPWPPRKVGGNGHPGKMLHR